MIPLRQEGKIPFRPVLIAPVGNVTQALAISDDGSYVAAIRLDHSVWLLNVGSRDWQPLGTPDAIPPIVMSGDGSTLAFADERRQVQILRLVTARALSLPVVRPPARDASSANNGRGQESARVGLQARPATSSLAPPTFAPRADAQVASRPVAENASPVTTPRSSNAKSETELAALTPGVVPPAQASANQQAIPSGSSTSEKVTFAADAFFDSGKDVIKPENKAKLDDLVSRMSGIKLEAIIAVGHTDSAEGGTDGERQKLSVRRAESVKSYLTSRGVEKNRIYTEGKRGRQPVADNKTVDGRAKNRRVEIEVVGTREKS